MTRHPLDHPQGNARVTYQCQGRQPEAVGENALDVDEIVGCPQNFIG
ncbi:hypothetical protein [Microcoleus sp. S13C4]